MPFLARDLEDMRRGWQKVADNYRMTLYVFEHHGQYTAVSQEGIGLGKLVETIKPAD
jgi:hypothetical protein